MADFFSNLLKNVFTNAGRSSHCKQDKYKKQSHRQAHHSLRVGNLKAKQKKLEIAREEKYTFYRGLYF